MPVSTVVIANPDVAAFVAEWERLGTIADQQGDAYASGLAELRNKIGLLPDLAFDGLNHGDSETYLSLTASVRSEIARLGTGLNALNKRAA